MISALIYTEHPGNDTKLTKHSVCFKNISFYFCCNFSSFFPLYYYGATLKTILMKSFLFAFLLFFNLCVAAQDSKDVYDPNAVKRDLGNFSTISIRGPFTVFFSKGADCSVAVSASTHELREKIETQIFGSELSIKIKDKGIDAFFKNQKLRVYISAPSISSIQAAGAVDFVVVDELDSDDLSLTFSGSSDMKGIIKANRLKAIFSGASDLDISGSAREAEVILSGASVCDATNYLVDEADIKASGASTIRIHAVNLLKAVASGASKIIYSGDPSKIDRSSSGASSIRKL